MAKIGTYLNGEDMYECSSCNNTWSLSEGFVIATDQCAGCQKWDDDKPQRDKEYEQRIKMEKEVKAWGNFPYMAGDPFW